jgi:hypothetical protein
MAHVFTEQELRVEATIATLRRLLAAATPGPWVNHTYYLVVVDGGVPVCRLFGKEEEDFPNAEANSALIVTAINALPEVLEAWERAELELTQLRQSIAAEHGSER